MKIGVHRGPDHASIAGVSARVTHTFGLDFALQPCSCPSPVLHWPSSLLPILLASLLGPVLMAPAEDLGLFAAQGDIGPVGKAGLAVFEAKEHSCVVAGGGENMWATNDAFHFVWTRQSGNFALSAGVEWLGTGGHAHRKACLLVRQSLSPDSPYVDVAVHGDGLTSLQYRETTGGPTREIQVSAVGLGRVGLARQGQVYYMLISPEGAAPAAGATAAPALQPSGASIRLDLAEPLYVGLGVCAHDNRELARAKFAGVELRSPRNLNPAPVLHCALETVALASKDRRVVYQTAEFIESPNWSPDGRYLLFNSGGRVIWSAGGWNVVHVTGGRIYRLPTSGGKPEPIDTGFAVQACPDHGFSPDGARLAITDQSRGVPPLIYTLAAAGGPLRQITRRGPAYWSGWSPDGSTLIYGAGRDGRFDLYAVPAEGGEERRLTSGKGWDHCPNYSPDGKLIYFSSDRTGISKVWRMNPDGTEPQQVTFDELHDWFPHPSPDGKWIVVLSYPKELPGHPRIQPVKLRLLPVGGGPIQELARLTGGQGTINSPSWSPDSRQVAFVSYELIQPDQSSQ
jgi:TolB protein